MEKYRMPKFSRPSPLNLLAERRILLVDDAKADRMLLMDFLEKQQCRVYIAEDGQDGYRKAQVVLPDLILMDVLMPVCDGITACRLLKSNSATRDIPLIFLTGAATPAERVAGLAVGAVDYISKPFDFEEVRLRLAIHLKHASAAIADDRPPATRPNLDHILFETARSLLLANLGVTPDLGGLAKAVNTNPRRLNAAFRQCSGVTVFDFLREARMKEARRLLSDTALEIQQVAGEMGFGSAANFATAFRERFGLTPSRFRQQLGRDV
jgi:DNA-binding response OmpR family regulator